MDGDTLTRFVHESFRALVLNEQFVCVGGAAAIRQNSYRFGFYDAMGDAASSAELAGDLRRFIADADLKDKPFTAFAASFRGPVPTDEQQFEDLLWQTLQQLSDCDDAPWAGGRDSDPTAPTFTFSFGGTSWFIVGLHPGSSRLTRRFAWPTLMFNPHDQFDRLRREGTYDRLRDVIRARDVALQGSVNPMLSDFGEKSEAAQYSGRRVDENWTCPFHAAARTQPKHVTSAPHRIEPQTGTAFRLGAGETLRVIDPMGEQVADLIAFSLETPRAWLSSGRTFDYNDTVYLTTNHALYSNRSARMLTIVEDTVGRHDFLYTPCSAETFALLYKTTGHHPSCLENLAGHLADYGIAADDIPTTFNIFMNVEIDANGSLKILPPRSRAGDYIDLRAEMDLVVGLTACSAEMSNNYRLKPIDYAILSGANES